LHKYRFAELVSAANSNDIERKSLFYIVAGNEELYQKRHAIYDFKENAIHTDFQQRAYFSRGLKLLILLGFNLYNGSSDYPFSPMDLINTLDNNNFQIAINAIKIRRN